MFNHKPLGFVSIEGNWNKHLHEERIANAASSLINNKNSFAIASGTNSPPQHASFFNGKLGVYTRDMLIRDYNIPAIRIIPAFLFPYSLTYTIIDAFTNAAIIGWISCGLKRRTDKINVTFEPSTSSFHWRRVELINNRACECLKGLNVNVSLLCRNKAFKTGKDKNAQEEALRLSALRSKGGLLETGNWMDNGRDRNLDDISYMMSDLFKAFNSTFPSLPFDKSDILNDLERLVFIFLWNAYVNFKEISNKDVEDIFCFIENNYGIKLAETVISRKITNLIKLILS